jgi:hypothetical protein
MAKGGTEGLIEYLQKQVEERDDVIQELYAAVMLVITLNDNPHAIPPGYACKLDPGADGQLREAAQAAREVLGE